MPRSHKEITFQKQCAEYLEIAVPKPPHGPFYTAVNPIPGSSPRLGKLAKDMGLRAGVPDFIFLIKGKVYGVELKVGKGGLSENQSACHVDMINAGAEMYTVKDLQAFIETVNHIITA